MENKHNCNWCGLRSDPPQWCNEKCERDFHEAAEKYFKMLGFLAGHLNPGCQK